MNKIKFDGLMVTLASMEEVEKWSRGVVDNPDTVNYRTGKPKQGGLFCESIFGPVKNFECSCGKYKGVRYKGIVCERCGVEVASSRERRTRMGHIDLASPVVHEWYKKSPSGGIHQLLQLSANEIDKILTYVKYVVVKDITDETREKVKEKIASDYESTMKDLDELYKKESSAQKEPKKLAEAKKLYEENQQSIEAEFNRIRSIVAEGELTPEEKLIQAIFGDKSKNVKDTSLYMPSGSEGKVVEVVILDSKKGDNLMAGVRKKIKVYVASTRKIEIWDKLAGKHGNKGIVATVVPEENMPYSADGKPVDVVLNSLWVISRMNLGQLFESQLGLIAKELGVKFAVPTFGGIGVDDIVELAKKAGLEDKLRTTLYDGETGEPYAQQVTVGYMHILKLVHMVEDKIHARSVGPYSLITQQPLGGKSRQGGQRFGEMEVWALEAYSAVYTLQEMLTVKSDDVVGRNKLYESIIKSQKPKIWWLPESFNLLTYLFKGLGQNIVSLTSDEMERIYEERMDKIKSLGLSGIMTASLEQELTKSLDEDEDEVESKGEMIGKVVEDLEDFGQIE